MNISNFYQYNEKLAAGAQPTAEQLAEIKANGYEVVVNISTPSARNAVTNEAQLVEGLKMDYIHFPVDCSNLRPIHYNTFKGIMNGVSDKKVFIHCGANIKSSNLMHMYKVLEKKEDETQSYATLRKIQNPEAKWISYFKSMGMKADY